MAMPLLMVVYCIPDVRKCGDIMVSNAGASYLLHCVYFKITLRLMYSVEASTRRRLVDVTQGQLDVQPNEFRNVLLNDDKYHSFIIKVGRGRSPSLFCR